MAKGALACFPIMVTRTDRTKVDYAATREEALARIAAAQDLDALEKLRVEFLGKQGSVSLLLKTLGAMSPEERQSTGPQIHALREGVSDALAARKGALEGAALEARLASESVDLTLPAPQAPRGSIHPVSQVLDELAEIFADLGFAVATGPEIEDDWHNFTALNFPENHPARDMQDTFFIEQRGGSDSIALRTHTSSVQVRVMESTKPPIRMLMPGRVYRNEAISARAHCFFHQVEGLYIDEGVSFADMKQTLLYFSREMFGADTEIRLRPSYFPFTEPSAEMDITCELCKGIGCNVCKYTGWLEIMGCGMVDPNVLQNCGIDPERYSGFAFGMGIERIAMLKYDVKDLRLFSENDLRFLRQFSAEN